MDAVNEKTKPVGEPTWEIAQLFPNQGCWSEEEYVALHTNHLVEFSDGTLEFLPMPTEQHQLIAAYLYRIFADFVFARQLGTVLFAPLRVKLWERKFREPDLVFMSAEHADRRGEKFWKGADLAVEVVSEDDPSRDHNLKRMEYAQAGIPEYWIVDPRDATITVLTLDQPAGIYQVAGHYRKGERATSRLLDGFAVEVGAVFSQ